MPEQAESGGPTEDADAVEEADSGVPEEPAASSETLVGSFERLPVLVYQPAAVYPAAALETGAEEEVLLQLAIDELGDVLEVVVVETGGEEFDGAAVQAARQYSRCGAGAGEGLEGPARQTGSTQV